MTYNNSNRSECFIIIAIDQNVSFDFILHIGGCMVDTTAKDIRFCIDSRDSYQECFLEKDSEGINVVLS